MCVSHRLQCIHTASQVQIVKFFIMYIVLIIVNQEKAISDYCVIITYLNGSTRHLRVKIRKEVQNDQANVSGIPEDQT